MSERSKGDTSSSLATAAPPTSGRVVKNPLLSASVTGLTFDDFQNKPLLLPAAPPIVHPTPVVSRESTPLVTVGKSSDIDTENLSEINLNDTSITSSSSNIADPSDENSNSLIESTSQIDNSIISQAASSFSQLPSVASSVFSTFSKKFNSSSGRDDFNSNPQLDIQPFTTPFVGQASVPQSQIIPPPSVFGNQQHQQQQQPQIALPTQSQPQVPPAEPPTFYRPAEVPSAPSGPTCPPPASGQNTYRLSAKKKIYAQIPGLSSSHQEPSLPASASSFLPPIGFETLDAPSYSEHPSYEKLEERKGGLFSLSNLGVPNVLQNLSGFVQSATGISQRSQEQPSPSSLGSIQAGQAPPPAYYPQTSEVNFSGTEQVQTTPSAVNFFAPPSSSAFIPVQVPSELSGTSVQHPGPFFQPPQGQPTTGILFSTQPPKTNTPEAGQPLFAQQQTFCQPTTSSSRPPSVGIQRVGQPARSLTPDTNPSIKACVQQQPSQPELNSETAESKFSRPPPKSVTPESDQASSGPLTKLFGSPPTAEPNFSELPPKSVTPESSSQINLNSDQATSGQPPILFEPTPTAGAYFSEPPPKRVIPELSSQIKLSSEQATSDQPSILFGPPPTVGAYFTGPPSKTVTPESSLQPVLNSEQATSGQPAIFFAPPPTAGAYFSGPSPKSVTPDSSSQRNLNSDQAASGQPPILFGPPPTAGAYFSGQPTKTITPESSLQPILNSEQATSVQPPIFFGPPPTAGTIFSGLPPKSVTPKSISQSSLKSEQTIPKLPSNFVGPPTTAGSYFSGQLPQSIAPQETRKVVQPVGNSEAHFAGPPKSTIPEANSSSNLFTPSLSSGQPPISLPTGIPLPLETPLPPQVKPPFAGPPSSSFRLQKGTRLYKSPFAAAPSEYQPQISQNPFPPAPEAVSYFNPQQAFLPPQIQGIPQLPIQASILNPFQEASILPPKDNPVLYSLATAPPLDKFPEYPPTGATRCAAPFASEIIPTKPTVEAVSFLNPGILDPSKEVASLNIQQPLAGADGVSIKPPSSFSSIDEPTIDTVSERPTIAEGVNTQEITPPSTQLDTETVGIEATISKQSSVSDQSLSTPPSEQASTTNPESESKEERSNLLQEQQNNILPPPPAVNFGISTPSKETANFPPPPPQHSFQNKPISNPYRKGLQPAHSQLPASTSLSSFFTPIDQGNNFFQTISSDPIREVPQPAANLFVESNIVNPLEEPLNPSSETFKASEELSQEDPKLSEETSTLSERQQLHTELESTLPIRESTPISSVVPEQNTQTSCEEGPKAAEKPASPQTAKDPLSFYKPDIAPPYSNDLPVATKSEENSKIASPLKSQDTPVPEPVPNLFTGFFDQAPASTLATPNPVVVQQPSLPDPTTFFDSFSLVPSLGVPAPPTEDPNSQRIQNFFNNPPPKELDTVGDLNYNLVGSGLSVQNLQIRSLTPASNLAEPPSSSCSEFSELNSSLSAANRQPLIQAADSTKVSPEEEAIFESPEYQDLPEEIVNELKMANSLLGNSSPTNEAYKPAVKHWFYKRKLDIKCLWTPFSFHDSALLEDAFLKGDKGPNLVAVEGGRFDVNISERTKNPVYWEGEPIEVKRCSWFYKANDSKYVPYEEETADLLEEEYKKASESCEWHKKIPISAGDIVVFHGPTVIVHFQPQQQVDSWGGSTLDSDSFLSYMKQQTITRPRVVKRDLDDFNIDEGESHKVDHLLFMVHGIGSACDLKMRSVEEVVDEFRSIALQLVQSHYKNSVESGCVGRLEVLPVSWHSELHSDEFGIDEKLKSITLESIPKLRNFTNDTLLDILFYTSPMFCQRIINTVTSSMNDIFVKYKQRNPEFQGEVSLAGHSLGSLIMFDLLCHQRPHKQAEEKNMENPDEMTSDFPVESNKLKEEDEGKNITYKMGQAGTGQPFISYPQLLFQPKKFFALGSPIGMFVTIRGIDKLGLDFRLPTCPGFYNIFHPYDPVAYRLEALVNPDMNGIPPVLIPHHKGRKRMHLELKETMSRVGGDLKQRFFETFKTTLDSVNFLTPKVKNDPKELKEEVDRLLELQAQQGQQTQPSVASTSRSRANSNSTNHSDTDVIEIDFPLGKLNDSKRVDYVLQEAPLEFFNEYLFALSSHVCYWESEDTILFVLKQIYNEIGISPDSQVPQQTMTIERPSSSGSKTQQSPTS